MGKRGPKPKPTRVKELQGNPGKRPLNDCEPRPTEGAPPCPSWLDREAKAKWRTLVPELSRLRLLTLVDGDALAAYCQAWAEFQASTRTLKKEGRFVHNAAGTKISHPAIAQQRSALQVIRAFSALFGLDPSSRSKISVPERDTETDALTAFLGETG